MTSLQFGVNSQTKDYQNMDSGQFIETFPITTDSLPKFRSFISSLLRKENYQIEHSESSEQNFVIVAAKGNKLLHYIAEKILEFIPLSELFGWAVRVQVSFAVVGQNEEGHYILRVVTEPACNEINPITSYLEQDDPRDFVQAAGEDDKCRDAFQHFTSEVVKSRYLAQKK